MDAGSASGYDDFAWLYDREWGRLSLGFVPVLDRLLLDALPARSRVLDIACGTGQLAAVLTERGFRVTGLDSSAEMLALARTHAPDADFILADARSFVLAERFDAAVSVFDSLNHIVAIEDLRHVFERVRAVLVPGAPFVFDLTTGEGQPRDWERSFVADDGVGVVRSAFDPDSRLVRFHATLFRPAAVGWGRADVTLLQRCHAEDEVRRCLADAGYVDVAVTSAEDHGLRPGRLFYAARARGGRATRGACSTRGAPPGRPGRAVTGSRTRSGQQ